jgi:hypothetical protein
MYLTENRVDFIPKGILPLSIVPSPRVIFRTRRKNLAHEARIERLGGVPNLEKWRHFAFSFLAKRPRLEPEIASYLLDRGFLPNKALLYGLPHDRVDGYLSDLQVDLLAEANGKATMVLKNRLLLRQIFRNTLPMCDAVAFSVKAENRKEKISTALSSYLPEAAFLSLRPAHVTAQETQILEDLRTSPISEPGFTDTLAELIIQPAGGLDSQCLVTLLPRQNPWSEEICPHSPNRVRLLVLLDPRDNLPYIVSAVQGFGTQASGISDHLLDGALSARINVETGHIDSVISVSEDGISRDLVNHPDSGRPLLHQAVPNWWTLVVDIKRAFRRIPLFAAFQVDALITPSGHTIVDVKGRVDAELFQVHGPIMEGDRATAFLREFGL